MHCVTLPRTPTQTTYTGVYKKGGPTTVDESQDLAAMLDRNARK